MRGSLADKTWCEFDGAILRVGKTDPASVQPIIDALCKANLVIRAMQLVRPSLEDLFFEAVTDPTTGRTTPPGAAAAASKERMSQTIALILDAYRDLNSRKMFWIVLILSTMVATRSPALRLTPDGLKIFSWHLHSTVLNSRNISPGDFYKTIFLSYGINFWLTWLATVLALISTASLFPDFLAGGAIDLYLSKPISRLRLFITKYLCGSALRGVADRMFFAASFLVIGLARGRGNRGFSWPFRSSCFSTVICSAFAC